jgi:hypothetical protein
VKPGRTGGATLAANLDAMKKDNRAIVFASCAIVVALVGVHPLMTTLYSLGLYPQVSQQELEARLRRDDPHSTFTCTAGQKGWDYICDVENAYPTGYTSRHRYAIISSWLTPVASTSVFPHGASVPSRSEYLARLHQGRPAAGSTK